MKTEPYPAFWQNIHRNARQKEFPLRVMFELTYRCNFFCKHCYVPLCNRKLKELGTKQVFSILDQLAETGCFYLGFTGGEPFIRRDFLKILEHAKKKGFSPIVYTNGSLIGVSEARVLDNLQINKVDITLPAMTKVAFEKITGVRGSHARVFRAIELLHNKKIALGFKTCVLKENQDQIPQIEKFCRSIGAGHRLDNILSPRLNGCQEPYRYRGRLREKSSKNLKGVQECGV